MLTLLMSGWLLHGSELAGDCAQRASFVEGLTSLLLAHCESVVGVALLRDGSELCCSCPASLQQG